MHGGRLLWVEEIANPLWASPSERRAAVLAAAASASLRLERWPGFPGIPLADVDPPAANAVPGTGGWHRLQKTPPTICCRRAGVRQSSFYFDVLDTEDQKKEKQTPSCRSITRLPSFPSFCFISRCRRAPACVMLSYHCSSSCSCRCLPNR